MRPFWIVPEIAGEAKAGVGPRSTSQDAKVRVYADIDGYSTQVLVVDAVTNAVGNLEVLVWETGPGHCSLKYRKEYEYHITRMKKKEEEEKRARQEVREAKKREKEEVAAKKKAKEVHDGQKV